MNPLRRTDAQIFTLIPMEEEQLYEDVKKLYKDEGKISTEMIMDKFKVNFTLALEMMARVIKEN